MKRSVVLTAMAAVLLCSCNEPEPRRPVSVKTGTFIKESIERNKKLLEAEEEQILALIKADTIHEFQRSANGYWYHLDATDSTKTYLPEEGDVVRIAYALNDLNNTPIYSREEIGEVVFKIDKEELFPGMRTAVKLLHEGESATFYFPSSMGYGYHGDDDKIGTNTPLIARVSLLEILEKESDSIAPANESDIN